MQKAGIRTRLLLCGHCFFCMVQYTLIFCSTLHGERKMVFFKSADVPAVHHCGTAQMAQKELIRRRNLHLPQLRGVEVLIRYRPDAHGNDTFVITFSHKAMDEVKRGIIREILNDATDGFKIWLCGKLESEHGWKNGCRIKLTSREKPEEYVWSVEKTAG